MKGTRLTRGVKKDRITSVNVWVCVPGGAKGEGSARVKVKGSTEEEIKRKRTSKYILLL